MRTISGGVVEKTLFNSIFNNGKEETESTREREKEKEKEIITLKDGQRCDGVHGRDEGAEGEALHKVQLVHNVRQSQQINA